MPRAHPSSAAAAPIASCSASSASTNPMSDHTASNDDDARDRVRIGLVSVSDRAAAGVYEDKGIPAPRDVTPEATLAVATKVMPGFGEQMRRIGLAFVPTAILSRQVAVGTKAR